MSADRPGGTRQEHDLPPQAGPIPEWLALPFYTLVALAFTFPTVLRLGTAFFGYAPDALYYIWLTWWRKFSLLQGLDHTYQPLSQYPFGVEQVVPGFSGLLWPLALRAGPDGVLEPALTLQPGETTITLRWAAEPPTGYPAVEDIAIRQ